MESTMETRKLGLKDLLLHKPYMMSLAANFISRFGDSVDAIAYSWMVYMLTGSKILMGTLFAVNCIPNIVFSIFSGVIVDHFPKKAVAILGDIGRGIIVSVTALLFLLGLLRPWHLFVFTFLNSTFETFVNPARTSLLPRMLPRELYMTATSFSSSLSSAAELIGAGCAGLIIGFMGISGAIFVDGITFFLSGLIFIFIRISGDEKSDESLSPRVYLQNLREGFKFIKSQRVILITLLLAAWANFAFSPINVLEPIYVKDILKTGPEGMSMMSMGFSIGMILGGLAVAQFFSNFKKGYMIISGFVGVGTIYALLSMPAFFNFKVIPPVVYASLCFLVFGIFVTVMNAPLRAYFLTKAPQEMLGRLSSMMGMLCMSAMPIGSALTGTVAEYIQLPVMFITMGVLIALPALALLFNKEYCSI